MSNKPRILFTSVASLNASFIKADYDILKKNFSVIGYRWPGIRNVKSVLRLVWYLFRSDLVFVWFVPGPSLALLWKILRKKSMIVASGYSVANMPEIGYGEMSRSKSARWAKFTLGNADKVVAVSRFNEEEILRYISPDKVKLIYHGVDCHRFFPSENKKDNLVLTVGVVTNGNLKRKGLEVFVRAAEYLPGIDFVLIGGHPDNSIDYLKSIATPNVRFIGHVSDEDLIDYYQRAKAYVQVSMHEAFGIAVAEAMLCECVPVVTNMGALPEVVGDTGFFVPSNNPKVTAEAIRKALVSDKAKAARQRIVNNFPLERREEELTRFILDQA